MKTLILTPVQLNLLSENAQKEIVSILSNEENTIKSLKERIKKTFNEFSYKIHDGVFEKIEITNCDYLFFEILEYIGNSYFSKRISLKMGNKYAVAIIKTYRSAIDKEEEERSDISLKFINEITSLCEASQKEQDEIDKEKLLRIACQRILNNFAITF